MCDPSLATPSQTHCKIYAHNAFFIYHLQPIYIRGFFFKIRNQFDQGSFSELNIFKVKVLVIRIQQSRLKMHNETEEAVDFGDLMSFVIYLYESRCFWNISVSQALMY